MRVLVAEDEKPLADAIAAGLRRRGFAVDVAYDGEGALYNLSVNEYAVLLLDRDLPKVHGDEVCRRVVAEGMGVRVLMVTGLASVSERVDGFGLGADDYLAKPFAFDELVARVRALARRPDRASPPVLERSGVRLDTRYHEVFRNGRRVLLSRKEFALLEELLNADGAPVSAETLLERVWDENIDPFTTIVRVTIRGLRRKLGEPQLIETFPGVGYRLG
ncbi:response regulator transcription factor [Actinorugispora endophytica]|uniref:DNA-binding response OmpR family regulator n=1 Tax=Actinorugispora endophytica TaxID=1605990 RepID=A0A4R6V9C5_9ACTN|nr:response regulator transcription factor [Actinorugispora endophytica]TDQ55428.1 DNA-binding response OmpR family regulator [Actinorugispora endophytica]